MFGIVFSLPLLLAIVFLVNIVPAFMPPTWAILVYYHITQGEGILELALLGALFSTLGRLMLAEWSGPIFSRFFNKNMHKNADFTHEMLAKKPLESFAFTFLYALSPFPSNAVFIVAGIAKLRLIPIVSGFFAGRIISYAVLMYLSKFSVEAVSSLLSFDNPLIIAIDLIGIAATIVFFLVDWRIVFSALGGKQEKKK
jgi:membrane protein YqaA with SNARE-associated domain